MAPSGQRSDHVVSHIGHRKLQRTSGKVFRADVVRIPTQVLVHAGGIVVNGDGRRSPLGSQPLAEDRIPFPMVNLPLEVCLSVHFLQHIVAVQVERHILIEPKGIVFLSTKVYSWSSLPWAIEVSLSPDSRWPCKGVFGPCG